MSGPAARLLLLSLAALAVGAAPAVAKPKRPVHRVPAIPPAVPRATVTSLPDGRRVDLVFGGSLSGWAAPRDAGGGRILYVLAAPEAADAPAGPCAVTPARGGGEPRDRRLFRWRRGAPGALDLVRADLPAGALDAADLDGDGAEELLLVRRGGIDAVRTEHGGEAVRALAADPRIGTVSGDPRIARGEDDRPSFRLALLGAFGAWTPGANGGLRETGEIDVPLEARPGRLHARVASPEILPLGGGEAGRPLFATAPEPVGFERVRTFLLDPDGPEATRRVECWARFPGRERLLESALAILNGRPVLIALSIDADSLSLLGGKKLRVFPLVADRTRAGAAPSLAGSTEINLWQAATPSVVDVDRDGRDDLVLAYWKGIKSTIAALEVHRQRSDGSFEAARTLDFDVAGGAPPFLEFGRDLDGDGRPDLLLLAAGALRIYPGSEPGRAARRPVATEASRVLPLAEGIPGTSGFSVTFQASSTRLEVERNAPGLGDPRLVDLDGDGRPEILFLGDGPGGARGSVLFVRASREGGPSSPPKASVASEAESTYN